MIARRRIFITEDDMARLRELVRQGKMAAHKDRNHLIELDGELERAEVIGAGEVMPDVDSGTSTVYTLVFPVDADIEQKRISVLAPIGTALLGFRTGDTCEWKTPGGTRRLQIKARLVVETGMAPRRPRPMSSSASEA